MNLKKIIQWYTSIEALSYLTTMIFGTALGFGLSTVLLIKSQNISDLIVILLKMTFLLIIIGAIFRLTTFTFYRIHITKEKGMNNSKNEMNTFKTERTRVRRISYKGQI